MPRLSQAPAAPPQTVEFVLSVSLDLMNAMYFTHLARDNDEVGGWPARTRDEMDPALRAELDFLYTFPKGQPGVLAMLGDGLFAHSEAWDSVDSLLAYVRSLPPGMGEAPHRPGIQGFIVEAACHECGSAAATGADDPRARLADAVADEEEHGATALDIFDRPEELRGRIIRLIERFYAEHYRPDQARRVVCLERSVGAHRGQPVPDVVELTRKLVNRPVACLESVCPGPYERWLFAPSLDMGPFISCTEIGSIHGLFYPCEAEFAGGGETAAEEERLARIFKALGDEQRLRILSMLRGREMYVQEVVERTGLHQSVVSRHLSLMYAVGLVTARKQNNMRFFSLNPQAREELSKTLDLFSTTG